MQKVQAEKMLRSPARWSPVFDCVRAISAQRARVYVEEHKSGIRPPLIRGTNQNFHVEPNAGSMPSEQKFFPTPSNASHKNMPKIQAQEAKRGMTVWLADCLFACNKIPPDKTDENSFDCMYCSHGSPSVDAVRSEQEGIATAVKHTGNDCSM